MGALNILAIKQVLDLESIPVEYHKYLVEKMITYLTGVLEAQQKNLDAEVKKNGKSKN